LRLTARWAEAPAQVLSQQNVGAIFARARVAVVDLALDPVVVEWVHGAGDEPPFGLSLEQTTPGSVWLDNVYPNDRPALVRFLAAAEIDRTSSHDHRLIVGDGELLWVRQWVLQRGISRATDRPWVRSLLRVVSEEKQLEWECLRVTERECNRIGQELHDHLCQVLTGLNILMRTTANRARAADPLVGRELDELSTHVHVVTERVRSLARGLFPAQLQSATLREALDALAEEIRHRFQIELSVDLPPTLPRHTPEQIIHVYRIVQEAAGNAVRHGQATHLNFTVTDTGSRLLVRVADNGVGFAQTATRPEGIGIHTMQYRARLLGGMLAFHEVAPHGVALELNYPPNFSTSSPC